MDRIETRLRMITAQQHSGKTVSDVCAEFGVSRETWYKWKKRYDMYGLGGLKDLSRRPHHIKYVKVTADVEKLILELRLNHRFGPRRIGFRLRKKYGVVLAAKTIYYILKKHKLNVLSVKLKRKYKRFEKKHSNDMVQMDTKGPFYLRGSREKQYLTHGIDDCSRKVVSEWVNRRSTEESLMVLKKWIAENGKPKKVMHDGGKQFVSKDFQKFLQDNDIKDKQIPPGYPQAQGKVEAYNKIVISEFLEAEELKDKEDGKKKYEAFVWFYNHEREHGGIGGMTPAEKFRKRLKQPGLQAKARQKVSAMLVHQFVNHVW
jgi:transposase InsO family protein